MASLDAPGAYPVTPLNEEPTQQTNANEMGSQGDSRGWNSSIERDAQPSGHNVAGSSIHVGEPSLAQGPGPAISSQQNPLQQHTKFDKETPRSLGSGVQSSHHRPGDSGVRTHDSPISHGGNNDKPGLMTGSYSRVGTQDSAFAPQGNYTYDNNTNNANNDTISSRLPHGGDSKRYDDVEPTSANAATNLFTPANAPAESAPLGGGLLSSATASSRTDDRGVDRDTDRRTAGDSSAKHSEPYWGDIPFGTGVYNGVTGHGSNESTAHQTSLRDRYDDAETSSGVHNSVTGHGSSESTVPQTSHHERNDVATSSGVYNGVTGHGSNKLTTPQMSIHDRYEAATGSGVYNGVTGHGSEESTSPQVSKWDRDNIATNDSHSSQRAFPLADNAGTTTSSRLADDNHHERDTHSKGMFAGGAGAAAAGGYAAHKLSHKDDNKRENIVDSTRGEEKDLPYRPSPAAPRDNRTEGQSLEGYSRSTENQTQGRDDSNLGILGGAGAAIGAGAGVGAYGMPRKVDRDNAEDHSSAAQYDTTSRSARDDAHQARETGWNETVGREESQYNTLSDGTPSGVTDNTRTAERSSSDSSHGGQYNVLSSGTPSGINLEQTQSVRRH